MKKTKRLEQPKDSYRRLREALAVPLDEPFAFQMEPPDALNLPLR